MVKVDEGEILMAARLEPDSTSRPLNQTIDLTYTAPHFGGRRAWFVCPGCFTRRAKLYGGDKFCCRECYGLAYRSQRENPLDRRMRRVRKIRFRLGGSGNLIEPFPARPKSMHHATYRRLQKEGFGLERQIAVGMRSRLRSVLVERSVA